MLMTAGLPVFGSLNLISPVIASPYFDQILSFQANGVPLCRRLMMIAVSASPRLYPFLLAVKILDAKAMASPTPRGEIASRKNRCFPGSVSYQSSSVCLGG